MTDNKELLELAAKAGGVEARRYVENQAIQGEYRTGLWCDLLEDIWNPLTDDGDALRLAVKLMEFRPYRNHGNLPFFTTDLIETRRAIVRAAAEIGKAM